MRDEAVHTLLVAEQQRLEPHRLECEARHVKALDWQQRDKYLRDVAKLRGAEAGDKLRAAVLAAQEGA